MNIIGVNKTQTLSTIAAKLAFTDSFWPMAIALSPYLFFVSVHVYPWLAIKMSSFHGCFQTVFMLPANPLQTSRGFSYIQANTIIYKTVVVFLFWLWTHFIIRCFHDSICETEIMIPPGLSTVWSIAMKHHLSCSIITRESHRTIGKHITQQ